jgi:hypothetical protein
MTLVTIEKKERRKLGRKRRREGKKNNLGVDVEKAKLQLSLLQA